MLPVILFSLKRQARRREFGRRNPWKEQAVGRSSSSLVVVGAVPGPRACREPHGLTRQASVKPESI